MTIPTIKSALCCNSFSNSSWDRTGGRVCRRCNPWCTVITCQSILDAHLTLPMYTIHTQLWQYDGMKGAWFFVTIDEVLTKKIKQIKLPKAKGWGSIRVRVTIGRTTWPTSIFPTKQGTYLLPIKASVRKREGIAGGAMVQVRFEPVICDSCV